ncbi:EAL domain-containing protein [Virgibacillus sediminis]|uniref:EAL-associated domain-containing protein n=1 Tax=Virgibacillus sediminis TaxID=202260 RepID=A0ABV7A8Z4_9BACI
MDDLDPLDIMLHQEKVVPHYEPIISADTQLVVGYEVKPYFQMQEDDIRSLDWFFEDPSIPDEFQLELSSIIQHKALETFRKTDQSLYLFFNYDARLLARDNGETLMAQLESYIDLGLDISRIYLELKEEFIVNRIEELRPMFNYMKALGLKIAVDDVGQRSGNLEWMAQVRPHVVKVDANFLKDNLMPHLYREVHQSLASLSRKIGSTLLFKEISSFQQLNYAWRNGGQFYQGSYLKRADSAYVDAECVQERMKEDFHHFVTFEKRKVKAQMELANLISSQFHTILSNVTADVSYDETILAVGKTCSRYAFRVYICNEEGIQLSSNAEKNQHGEWELYSEGRHKNWSWRPYFFENIIRMNVEKKGILSDLYTDIERDEQIRTYSYPLSNKLYIFLDVPYEYLYEQEGLL